MMSKKLSTFYVQQLTEWAVSSFVEVDDESYNADAEIATMMIERTANFLVKWTRTVQV